MLLIHSHYWSKRAQPRGRAASGEKHQLQLIVPHLSVLGQWEIWTELDTLFYQTEDPDYLQCKLVQVRCSHRTSTVCENERATSWPFSFIKHTSFSPGRFESRTEANQYLLSTSLQRFHIAGGFVVFIFSDWSDRLEEEVDHISVLTLLC